MQTSSTKRIYKHNPEPENTFVEQFETVGDDYYEYNWDYYEPPAEEPSRPRPRAQSGSRFSWGRFIAAFLLTIPILTLIVPVGWMHYQTYRREHRHFPALPDEMQAVCTRVLNGAPEELEVSLSNAVQPQRLQQDMQRIVGEIGNRFVASDGDEAVREYVLQQLAALGYSEQDGSLYTLPFTIDIEATRERWVKKEKDEEEEEDSEWSSLERSSDHAGPGDVEGAPDETQDEDEFDEDDYELIIETYHIYYDSESVVAVRPTKVQNPGIVVISAHLDTVYDTDGAIDNGSGVAALLETARVLSASRQDFGVEIRFCFFSGEELGMHGASNYLDTLSEEERARHIGMINIDMAACSNNGIPKAFSVSTYGRNTGSGYETGSFAHPANNAVSSAAIEAFSINSFGVPRLYAPIHWEKNDLRPFHRAGIDAITISWREIDPSRAITNFNIASPLVMHTTDDRLDTMDMRSLEQTARLTVATFERFARHHRRPDIRILGERG